jgi:hypothetical protein
VPGVESHTHRALGPAALNWILKRGIHLASLQLPPSHDINEAEFQSIRNAVASLALNGRLDKLESISLNRCYYIESADLSAILSKCYRSAKSIDIRICGLTVSAADDIKRCTKLEAFAANGDESAADMVEIVQSCRKLRMVDLKHFGDRLTDEVVQSVAIHCPFLERFELFNCSAVSDTGVRKVAESCPLLQVVDLNNTNITDESVVLLCNRCPLLKRMFLGYCRNLTDAAVLAVAERLPGLTHIELSGNTAITSRAMETLASKCRELEHIHLSTCPNVSDATLVKIADHCSKLELLSVFGCRNVTAVGLIEIATKCSKLKTVDIRRDELVTSMKEMFPRVDWQ